MSGATVTGVAADGGGGEVGRGWAGAVCGAGGRRMGGACMLTGDLNGGVMAVRRSWRRAALGGKARRLFWGRTLGGLI